MEKDQEHKPIEELKDLEKQIQQEEKKVHELERELHDEQEKIRELAEDVKKEQRDLHRFVWVAVITASGNWPKEDFEKRTREEKVKLFLEIAARELRILSTNGWIAKVGGHEIDQEKSYEENGLKGEVCIDYGPKHTGGGA
jgi:TolA-binding protein